MARSHDLNLKSLDPLACHVKVEVGDEHVRMALAFAEPEDGLIFPAGLQVELEGPVLSADDEILITWDHMG